MKKMLVLLSMICLAVPLSIGMVGCDQGGSSEPAASAEDEGVEFTEEEALGEDFGTEADDEGSEE